MQDKRLHVTALGNRWRGATEQLKLLPRYVRLDSRFGLVRWSVVRPRLKGVYSASACGIAAAVIFMTSLLNSLYISLAIDNRICMCTRHECRLR